QIRTGDGTRGWPEAAPFDAIIVSAGGPRIPDRLRQQLAIGGRMIIPVGSELPFQQLMKVTRTGKETFRDEDLGDVMFVPLIGAHGWDETATPVRTRPPPTPARTLPDLIRAAAEPLPAFEDQNFAASFDRFAQARVVCLGESSHGTAEFYRA